ncbi:TIGR01459 family HAD-type hydrolase [Paralimibaculum aggregatum]|uniref:TIGR01459 family HAD-type hydrolase n=1 Tax=Paralimibaculum aggregatum TaxID=3036245 RepID=A0ABQ6LDJ2_9RHOB|nr:TIGR01459 family HAD-type hydrolase [Limibaculum sp. NKW23]GMG81421.1 TIGR01459 family HAD-type hydrolase [Limibaculum sp. NKW23]
MTNRIARLSEVSGRYRALLCDLWGCYHDGVRPFPAALEALREYRAAGGIVILLTNAPRPVPGVQRFLDKIGAPSDTHDAVLSSGEVCLTALREGVHGRRIHYVGPDRDLGMLSDAGLAPVPLAEAEALLCTGLRDDSTETPETYAGEIADWAARGLPMLCTNPDIVVDRGADRLWCAGALARDYAAAGGVVHYFGKPHLPVYDASFRLLEAITGAPVPRAEVLAVGDGIHTDIAGAAAAGIDSVFLTGGIAAERCGPDPLAPEPGRVAAFLAEERQAPTFWMPRLA